MTAKIKLNAASGGGSVSLKAPSTTTSNAAVELQLPVADGTNGQVLKTDGSGNLSFGADTGGKLLQVVTTNLSSTFSTTSTSLVDVTGYNLSITPTAASSKIKVSFNADHYTENSNTFNQYSIITIARSIQGGSYTSLYTGVQGAYIKLESWPDNEYGRVAMIILDAPTYTLGNSITYKMQIRSPDTSVTSAIMHQRSSITASNIILEEIGA